MARHMAGCALVAAILLKAAVCEHDPAIPDVKIEALRPRGVRISIPDVPEMSLFTFKGKLIKQTICKKNAGTIRGEVMRPTNGSWTFEDPDVTLREGDEIEYYVFAEIDRKGHLNDHLTFKYPNIPVSVGPRAGEKPRSHCQTSQTEVRGRTSRICSGATVFEEHFDSLDESTWQIEQYIPVENPEYPFVSYQRLAVSVENGSLRIEPKLQSAQPGFGNIAILAQNLDLTSGCTAPACFKQASGPDILPPVLSGRIISKGFSFKYGTVHVRAKLPQGDWLYPEIMLESFLKRYGNRNFASGVLKIATARGNERLNNTVSDFGNSVLYGGAMMDSSCRHQLLATKPSSQLWSDDFHEYSVYWGPDRIILLVDGVEWGRIEPASTGLSGKYPQTCTELPRSLLATSSRMAPFDDFFYITLGVAAGGVTEFSDDDLRTGSGAPKPWKNGARKAMLTFWNDMMSWYPTWRQPALIVDYVKVIAV